MRNTPKGSGRGAAAAAARPAAYVPVKFPADEADKLRLAARADTRGNVSEFIRRAVRERIAAIVEAA